MSEEKPQDKLSPEEKEINLELKRAQASKLKAEAQKIQTEAEILSNSVGFFIGIGFSHAHGKVVYL